MLASSVLWFMVPLVISLYVSSQRIWWLGTGVSVLAVFLFGCSRVYLGVYWPTDVLAGYLRGAMLLASLDLLFRRAHAGRRCDLRSHPLAAEGSGACFSDADA